MIFKNINYKYTTIGLSIVVLGLFICCVWNMCFDRDGDYKEGKKSMMMHRMGDESMMMNHGGSVEGMMMDMLANMRGKSGKELEKAFITDMIPHHQGAVDMAKLLLEDKTISSELRKFAQDIITAQESEIKIMNEWLKKY
ncbi:MAG: hypothetical protein RI935_348 [Candidatus Parcubacteria bacterium]|jgi:uncharacterized protein (DUF305 family)